MTRPIRAAATAAGASPVSGSARNRTRPSSSSVRMKPTCGSAIDRRRMTSAMACVSARSPRRKRSRAGVAKKRSRSSTTVPRLPAAGRTSPARPPVTVIWAASAPATRLVMVRRPTAPRLGSASPRKPKLRMSRRSEPSIFDVAWRASASGRSAAVIPQPSSLTRISRLPPPAIATSIRRAPASSAFSTSSLTAEAGRSTTSPAAMRFAAASSSCRITGRMWGSWRVIPQDVACRHPYLPEIRPLDRPLPGALWPSC